MISFLRSKYIAVVGLALSALTVFAQEQQTGICAPVKMQILQQLTLERVGFLATLTITDNTATDPITGFAAHLTFENPQLSTNGANDSSSIFFVQPPTYQNVQNVNGSLVIQPGQTATVSWFIIPAVTAGGTNANGVRYNVGSKLSGSVNGTQIPASSLQVIPAQITVAPDAQLQITYFTPRDTVGIDPMTGQGTPIPFTFGVLVQNVGYGTAKSVQINSQQPQIVQNVQNLPLVAQLLGTRVNDSALSNANLTVNLGDLNPGQASKGAWDMITSFSGTFLSVDATYTHSTALGGKETSLIQSVNAYLFSHEVMDDQPGRDSVKDFLADTSGALDSIKNLVPDTMYESQGGVYPVNFLTNTTISPSGNPAQVNLTSGISGWGYLRLNDPGQAKLPITRVVRSDGKVLNTNNYWTSIHYEPVTNAKDTYLNILDLVGTGSYTYSVTYTNSIVSTNAPVTTLNFAGQSTFTNGVYVITPATQMYFISQDVAPVTVYYSLNGGSYQIGYPFTLSGSGQYTISYYGIDSSSNVETIHTATVLVSGSTSLGFASATVPSQPIFASGDAVSIRPENVPISFQALPSPTMVNAQVDIFQGVNGWATVSNVPSSPASATTASLNISGSNVDFYIYRLNGNSWSTEASVTTPLALAGLTAGTNTVSILGRSQLGTYPDASNAITAVWIINSSAPPTTIKGAPASPAINNSAQLAVSGAGVTDYRWTLNRSFFQPSTAVANPIVISNLSTGTNFIAVLGGTNTITQATNNPTTVSWVVNPLYGYDSGGLSDIYSIGFTNIGSSLVSFNWNGKSATGVAQPPGWYTVRITLADSLGHTNFMTRLIQINSLAGTNTVLANYDRGPQAPYARGRWAVWQDQSDGNWEIYARDLTVSNNQTVKITSTPLSQQNPKTDGRYVVWQGQELNGNWDIFYQDLNSASAPQALTSTPKTDEINPAIDWPWVVYQSRANGSTIAPWQLIAYNIANGQRFTVSTSTQDELNPDVQAGRVVWQDFRDAGAGEIYLYDLENSLQRRITTNGFSQFTPVIYGNWIAWTDNRNTQLDIYGFDLLRNAEVRITSTAENESRPFINGQWLVCLEDSLGASTGNPRLIHLPSLRALPITHTATLKSLPALADGSAVWLETTNNQSVISAVSLPTLQAVFNNQNLVAITPAMISYAQNAYGLLALWATNGVQSLTFYTSLVPQVTTQTATLNNGVASGNNFNLVAGNYLWVKFNNQQVLDLGVNNRSVLNLTAGVNVFAYSAYPDSYSAYQLLRQAGLDNATSVRMLDSKSGRWLVAEVQNGVLVGNDFIIPNTAVLMLNLTNPINQFVPQTQ